MNLYYVVADPEGEDYGLILRAENHLRALDCWRQHFAHTGTPDRIKLIEENSPGDAGAVAWDEMVVVWERFN